MKAYSQGKRAAAMRTTAVVHCCNAAGDCTDEKFLQTRADYEGTLTHMPVGAGGFGETIDDSRRFAPPPRFSAKQQKLLEEWALHSIAGELPSRHRHAGKQHSKHSAIMEMNVASRIATCALCPIEMPTTLACRSGRSHAVRAVSPGVLAHPKVPSHPPSETRQHVEVEEDWRHT